MQTITLSAAHADVNGSLKIMNTPLAHTIHYWNNNHDVISWVCNIREAGNYRVKLNYSLDKPLTGGVIQIRVGENNITFETSTTDSWNHFLEVDAGIISIAAAGTLRVELQGVKLPEAEDAAYPDIHTLLLVPVE